MSTWWCKLMPRGRRWWRHAAAIFNATCWHFLCPRGGAHWCHVAEGGGATWQSYLTPRVYISYVHVVVYADATWPKVEAPCALILKRHVYVSDLWHTSLLDVATCWFVWMTRFKHSRDEGPLIFFLAQPIWPHTSHIVVAHPTMRSRKFLALTHFKQQLIRTSQHIRK